LLQLAGVRDAALKKVKLASVVLAPLLVWLPLLVLSALDGKLLPGTPGTPFLLDLSAHIRLLVALPLFLLAGLVAEVRIIPTLAQFTLRRLIPDESMERFRTAIDSALRLGNSILADLVIIALIYSIDALVVRRSGFATNAGAWYARLLGQRSVLTHAGIFYAYVSLPILQFILLRWYYRLLIWGRLLARVSKLNLRLVPTHPDRLGGLGFLVTGAQAFTVFAMAHGALLAGWLSTRVVIRGAPLQSFKTEFVAVPVFVISLCIAPLLMFTGSLLRTKRNGIQEYGALAARYAREFDDKWAHGSALTEPLLGSADIQSLADMGGSYDIIQSMRSVAITPQMIAGFAVAALLPVAPLLLTLMPLSEILKKLAGMLF
jgi:hypothetical protein